MPRAAKSVKKLAMKVKKKGKKSHPKVAKKELAGRENNSDLILDTFGGDVRIIWDPNQAVTAQGQLAFFSEFLKRTGILEDFIKDCPINYESNNASTNEEVIGMLLLSILSGHNRYSHVTNIRKDQVSAELLGLDEK